MSFKTVAKHLNQKETPQHERIPGRTDQVRNSEGGYVFEADKWTRLNRFLALGTDGGSFYASEKALTLENAEVVLACLNDDRPRTIETICTASEQGKVAKLDATILAAAIASSYGEPEQCALMLFNLHRVLRIPTHYYKFAEVVSKMRGWGPALRKAIARYYLSTPVPKLAYHAAKYQQREGWSHRDLLRLTHPKAPEGSEREVVFRYILDGMDGNEKAQRLPLTHNVLPDILAAADSVKGMDPGKGQERRAIVQAILDYRLTREMVPTEALKHAEVWEALLVNMPMTAMIRNLVNMEEVGLLKPMSTSMAGVVMRLTSGILLRKARIHPYQLLLATVAYEKRSKLKNGVLLATLDVAFHDSFGNIETSSVRTMLGLDVSGSMGWTGVNGGGSSYNRVVPTCAQAAACMAMVTARTEPNNWIMGFSHEFRTLSIGPRTTLTEAMAVTRAQNFGGTNCSLPMLYALEDRIEVDHFVVYTDDETWCGDIQPSQALAKYRKAMDIKARLTVVAMAANKFTIADPKDPGMLDVAGFMSDTPNVIAAFGRGDI